jgi:hypothetical protein
VKEVVVITDVTVTSTGTAGMTLVIYAGVRTLSIHLLMNLLTVCATRVDVDKLTVVGVGMLRQEHAEVRDGPMNFVKQVGVPIGTGV